MKLFLKNHKKILILVFIFIAGFMLGWYAQIYRVYDNCINFTKGNPVCEMYKDFF